MLGVLLEIRRCLLLVLVSLPLYYGKYFKLYNSCEVMEFVFLGLSLPTHPKTPSEFVIL